MMVNSFLFTMLFLPSVSKSNHEAYLHLNNVTLPLNAFLRNNCSERPCLDYELCDKWSPVFFCERNNSRGQSCLRWCIGEGTICSDYEECCGSEHECIDKVCRSIDGSAIEISKIALIPVFILTGLSLLLVCWKGLIEPKCYESDSYSDSDSDIGNPSVRAFGTSRAQIRPSYEANFEKPPSYEECIGDSRPNTTNQGGPPPYSVASLINQAPATDLAERPQNYFIPLSTDISHLTLNNISLEEAQPKNIKEITALSPVLDIRDFKSFSTVDGASSSANEFMGTENSNDEHSKEARSVSEEYKL